MNLPKLRSTRRSVSILLPIVLGCLATKVTFAVPPINNVGFMFQGIVSSTQGPGINNLSPSITNGAPFFGQVRYAVIAGIIDSDPSTNQATFTMPPATQTIQITIGTNTFTSDESTATYIAVVNDGSGSPISDRLTYSTSAVLINGSPLPGSPESRYMSIDLSTTNLNAINSDAFPLQAPSTTSFVVEGANGYRVGNCYTYKNGIFYYGFSLTIDTIRPLPEMRIERQGANVLASWPAAPLTSFQSAPSLNGPWTNLTASASVTNNISYSLLPATGSQKFFRLQLLPGAN